MIRQDGDSDESHLCAWEPLDQINQPVAFIFPRLVWDSFLAHTREPPRCGLGNIHVKNWAMVSSPLNPMKRNSDEIFTGGSSRGIYPTPQQGKLQVDLTHCLPGNISGSEMVQGSGNTDLCISGGVFLVLFSFFWEERGYFTIQLIKTTTHSSSDQEHTPYVCACVIFNAWLQQLSLRSNTEIFFLHNQENHLSAIKKKKLHLCSIVF